MPLDDFLTKIKRERDLVLPLTHHERLPAHKPRYKETEMPLPRQLTLALKKLGVWKLYSHQAETIDLSQQGHNSVVITPTASGKSLIYNLSVISDLLRNEGGHAIYLFPLKALAQDQAIKLKKLLSVAGLDDRITVDIYDGDSSTAKRAKMRKEPPSILITNPDMLHLAILAYHGSWEKLLRNLRFIILDELHIYRGVFGSHILHILHRLNRLCENYGTKPKYIATSATISGARELAEQLTGQPFRLVKLSGAPINSRHFLFFRPEISYLSFSLKLFAEALNCGLKAIAFTKARRTTELLHSWLRQSYPHLTDKVSSYRAGFLIEERRTIERQLIDGKLNGVISTSALELGIDIGGLDVCVLVGYPGTVATTWQRAGRVGRGDLPSAICLVAGQDQLDQYFTSAPSDFFARSVEKAIVDLANEQIAKPHILCAAQELPIAANDALWNDDRLKPIIRSLIDNGKLLQSASGDQLFSSRIRPHRLINIRPGGAQYTIELEGGDRSLGSIGGRAVFSECHPGAVYLHRGEQFIVKELDVQGKRVIVEPTDAPYYTLATFDKETEILDHLNKRQLQGGEVKLARLRVTEQLTGYQKRRLHSQGIISRHEFEYPPESYETIGVVISIPEGTAHLCGENGDDFRGGIHGVEHAMLGLAPLFAMCDRNDMGGYSQLLHPQVGTPTVFMYDAQPGGIGLSARLFEMFPELIEKTLTLISGCNCEIGCPSCIHSPKCGSGNIPLDKSAAITTLKVLAGKLEAPEGVKSPILTVESKAIKAQTETLNKGGALSGIELPPFPKPVPTPDAWRSDKSGVVFDIETRRSAEEVGGWGHISKMGVACISAYRFPQNEWLDFTEETVNDAIELLKESDLVIGFNSIRFDYTVLSGYSKFDFDLLPSYDIMAEIQKTLGHRLSLNAVGSATLGAKKTADGLQSLQWWKEGRLDKTIQYCRYDVEITRDLFFYLLENGYLLFEKKGIGLVRAPVRIPEL